MKSGWLSVAIVLVVASQAAGQSWTTPRTWVAGEVVTAAIMNTHVRDNLDVLRSGGIAVTSQAAGDLLCASSATQFVRIAAGTDSQPLAGQGAGQCPAYDDTISVTSLSASGVVDVGDGSAAAPTLTFGNDTDNGLYYITTNQFGFSTGGNLRVDMDTTTMTFASGYSLRITGANLASLPGSPSAGEIYYCTDCLKGSDPCTGSSTGAFAVYVNTGWQCM